MSNQAYALVIGDNLQDAQLFSRILAEAGYQAQSVYSAHEAQVRLTFTRPDLVLLHLPLPMMKASVLLRQIRGNRRLRDTRVIGVSRDPGGTGPLVEELDLLLAEPIAEAQLRQLAQRLLPQDVAV
jgi:CheY-like chemotaxis protein